MWEFVAAVTGWNIDGEEAYRIGERIANIRQAFNIREGFNALNHPIHPRMVGLPPLKQGPMKGITVDMDTLLQDFLKAMRWDLVTARPRAKKLIELGLKDVAEDLR
jgi:aldehyde:ferredoxin oxidoreductase